MGKGKKLFNKKRKGSFKAVSKKKKYVNKEHEGKNKKAIFNRYKDKQKVEEELAKRKLMEQRFQKQQATYSESEEEIEEDTYGQLVSCFKCSDKTVIAETDDDTSGVETDDGDNVNKFEKSKEMDQNENSDQSTDDESSGGQDILVSNLKS